MWQSRIRWTTPRTSGAAPIGRSGKTGANPAVGLFTAGAAAHLLNPPVNVLRLSLHPKGLAPRIANLAEWRGHLLARLAHQVQTTADGTLVALLEELKRYPGHGASSGRTAPARDYAGIVVPLELVTPAGTLAFFSTTTVFGTPVDVTLAELAVEAFFPADAATAEALRK